MQAKREERTLYYGKGDVWLFRTYGKPLEVKPIPESAYTGSGNVVTGMNISVAVSGERFLPSFTEGDNSMVVATDSMKNFILRNAALYEGSTTEGLLAFLGAKLLETYPQMSGTRMSAEAVTFDEMAVGSGRGVRNSGLVFRYSSNEGATAIVETVRSAAGTEFASHAGGIAGLKLLKVKGSGFSGFVRDEYTTLPETNDRPLFIFLNIGWSYADCRDAFEADRGRYAAAEQVRDIAATVFHEEHSPSIQHLIYRIGIRILQRFPQLGKVWFETNNRTWETVTEDTAGGTGGVFTEPRPPYGFQGFSLTRDDLPMEAKEAAGEREAG